MFIRSTDVYSALIFTLHSFILALNYECTRDADWEETQSEKMVYSDVYFNRWEKVVY